jgi:hypothetical protein
MFKDVTAKFYALAAKGNDNINITQLIDTEMRFVNFNLDFKHDIKKDIRLDSDIPDFKGNIAELSIAFWALIRFSMARARATKLKEFSIITGHDNKYVNVVIKNSGVVLPDTTFDTLMDCVNNGSQELADDNIDQGVLNAFLILNKYDARINIFSEENFNTISIGLPYRNKRTEKKDI